MKYNFTNPYLSALERQQRALGLMPGSQNEIPKLGSLSSLNDSLNITTPGINFNAPGSMNSLNSSLSNFDPFGDDVLSQNVGQSIASGNPLDPNSFIKSPNNKVRLTPDVKPFDNYMNPQNTNPGGSLSILEDLTKPEVPEYSKFGNFLSCETFVSTSATQLIPFELTPITIRSGLILNTSLILSLIHI